MGWAEGREVVSPLEDRMLGRLGNIVVLDKSLSPREAEEGL